MTGPRPLLALLLAISAPACTTLEPETGPSGSPGGKADDLAGPDAGAVEVPELAGAYALALESTVQVRDLETGETKDVTTTASAHLTVEQDGASLAMSFRPCAVTLPEVSGRQPTIDDAFVRSIPPIRLTGALVVEEGQVELVTEPAALQLGIALVDPIADDVPADPDDPAVIDQDDDGKPGVSVYISGFRVFAGVRVVFTLAAPIDPDQIDSIEGAPSVDVTTRVYGDTIPFFDARDAAAEAAETSEVVSEHHSLRLEALDADAPACL